MPENSQFFEEYYRDLLPKRSYDLSHSLDTSGRIGTVFPVLVEEMIPGDTIKCRMSHITKFMPLISPIQGYVQARFETFFCPNQILMDRKRWETLISNPLNQDFGEIVDQLQLTPNVYNDFSFENWRTLCNSVCVPHMFATTDESGDVTYHGLNDAYDAYSYADYLKNKTLLNATAGNDEYTLADHCSVWQRDNYAYVTYTNSRPEYKLGIGWSPNEHIEEPNQLISNTLSAHFENYIGQNTLFDYMGLNIPSMNFTSLEYSLKDGIYNDSCKFDWFPNSPNDVSNLQYKKVFARQAQIELDKYHSNPEIENAVGFVLRSLNSREALETCLYRLFGIKVAHDENDSPIIPISLLQYLVGDFFYSTRCLPLTSDCVFDVSANYEELVRRFDGDNMPWFVPNDSDNLLNFRYIINQNHYTAFCNAKELLINPVSDYGITSTSWFFPLYSDYSAMQTVDKQFYEDIATQLFYNLYVFGCAFCDMIGFASSSWSYYMGFNRVPYQADDNYPSGVVNERASQKTFMLKYFFNPDALKRSDLQFNVLPLRTYSKIFNDWYQIPDFEFPRYIHDGDEVNEFTDFSLFSRAYARDRFVTAFTNPTAKVIRIGDVNVSDLLGKINISPDGSLMLSTPADGVIPILRQYSATAQQSANFYSYKSDNFEPSSQNNRTASYASGLKLVSSEVGAQVGGFSIEELRVAVRLQNMADYLNKFSGDYVDYMRSVFTVVPSDASLRRSTIVHSYRDAVNVSDILTQTNAEGDQVPAQRYGSAISLGSTPDFDYTTKEHGYLVTLMSIEPIPGYCQGLAPFWKRRTALDFYTPHMCTPQLTPIFRRELLHNMYGSIDSYDKESTPYSNESVFGYNEPDLDYKVRENRVSGNVRNKLRTYSLSRLFNSSLTNIGSEFVRIDSRDYDYMFNYIGTEYNSQFVANLYFNMTKYSVVDNEDSEPVLGGEL